MDLLALMILKKECVEGAEGTQLHLSPASCSDWEPVSWQKQGRGRTEYASLFIENTVGRGG